MLANEKGRQQMRRRQVRLFTTAIPALAIAVAALIGSGTFAAVRYSEQPSFCATCHEMAPYHDAWAKGPHKGVSCVTCHVAPGTTAQYTHKIAALKEVLDHFTTSPKFPTSAVIVPDSRCTSCHTTLPAKTASGFDHASHLARGTCVSCHTGVGHSVTTTALAAAGILDSATATAAAGADLAHAGTSHVAVMCSRCHDLTKTCEKCHTPPAKHYPAACTTCHDPKTPFASGVFDHTSPAAGACSTCHAKPAGHRATAASCPTCHRKAGVDWSFTHPSSASCATCHSKAKAHVATSLACATCHRSPGHSWAFTHPASTSCASCHTPPASHFSGACATCHKPTIPFASAVFQHPGISAPHGVSGKPCAACHPSGPPAVSCTCHGGGNGP
jgi:nitrate/TMAO reductase-like tetraheme cytochrome c subunit